MARLIDADEFERYIRTNCKDNLADLWCELIRRQPTAYDVDKVVEELQDLTIEFEAFGMCNDYVEISHAIETVRAGGNE